MRAVPVDRGTTDDASSYRGELSAKAPTTDDSARTRNGPHTIGGSVEAVRLVSFEPSSGTNRLNS